MWRHAVRAIIADVRARGDEALIELRQRFDGVELTAKTLRLTDAEIAAAEAQCDKKALDALDVAASRIEVLSPPANSRRRTLHRRCGRHARLALDGARQRRPLCAGRHGELSKLRADECGSRARRRRCAHRDGDAGERWRDQSADAGGREAGRGVRNLSRRRRAGRGCAWLTARKPSRLSTRSWDPATPMWRRPSAKCSALSESIPLRGHRKFLWWPMRQTIPTGSPPIS